MHKDRVIIDKSFFKKNSPSPLFYAKNVLGKIQNIQEGTLQFWLFPLCISSFTRKKKSGNFKNVFVVHYPIFMHTFWTLPAMTSSVDCWMRMWDCNVMQRTQPLDTKLKLKSIISSRNSNKKLVMQTFDRMSTESDIQLFIYIFRVLQNQKKY